MSELTHNQLLDALHYDPLSGMFTWKKNRGRNHAIVGRPAGVVCTDTGYVKLRLHGRQYTAHRLAWFYMNRQWPVHLMDHKNGNRADNRFCNLREASPLQNGANAKLSKANTSGYKGVVWFKSSAKWRAMIMVNRKRLHLGLFDDIEEARKAYEEAAKRHFGDFHRA